MRWLTRLLTVALLCATVGLHWGLLQAFAWGSMFARFVQSAPVTTALSQTFDPARRCALCEGISRARQAEQRQQAPTLTVKFDWIAEGTVPPLIRTLIFETLAPPPVASWVPRFEPPTAPPPRVA